MKNKILLFLFIINLTFCSFLYAKEYNVLLSELPTTEMYVKLIKALGEATNNTFNFQKVPYNRAIILIGNKWADFGMPIIQLTNEKKYADLKYDYSTSKMNFLCFVLYVTKNKNIDVAELKRGNAKNYKIETENSHIDLFNFKCTGSSSIEGSLKKVDIGRIDAFLFAQTSTDRVLKQFGLKNIKRKFFNKYNNVFFLQKGAKGGEIDKMLTDGINKLKANGKYIEIMGNYLKEAEVYNNWQP